MLRLPVFNIKKYSQIRLKSSSYIRNHFIDYFVENHEHKHVKSSSVLPFCDPTVPFVNAGMNQFKGVFLGMVNAPCPRAVNSQKCIRVGGKHNDLDLIGLDGHHHTFFEMLGNWSFGDYHKKEACQMAWDLLLGPFKLKPEELIVTYFEGDAVLGLPEDTECRDIWKEIGVSQKHIKSKSAKDNFWEMGLTGPCGPCTEIHYINPDGSLTEIWNIVFMQFNREADGSVRPLRRMYVDTGLGLERLSAILQLVPSNYDTDLFRPIITTIEQNCKMVAPYNNSYAADANLDQEYRRLADHARMVSVCLADGVYPTINLNLKQIMRKSFKICTDVFKNPNLMICLYEQVASILGDTYPELVTREKHAKLIIEHELERYRKFSKDQKKKMKEFIGIYPEVKNINDMDLTWFVEGYTELKETMSKQNLTKIPAELALTLHGHGFKFENIERIAKVNDFDIDREGFEKLLTEHKSDNKKAINKQVENKGIIFNKAIEILSKKGVMTTDDKPKYDCIYKDNEVYFEPLKTRVVALFNENIEWVDFLEPCQDRAYYVVTEKTNYYSESGGQAQDTGEILFNENVKLKIDSAFKIRDYVFHKGYFVLNKSNVGVYVNNKCSVTSTIDSVKRLNLMRSHTAAHLVHAALVRVSPSNVWCPFGGRVAEKGPRLTYTMYGSKLTQKNIIDAEKLIRKSIEANVPVRTEMLDIIQLSSQPDVMTVPGAVYPETDIRMVSCGEPLQSKELCCGTHVPRTAVVRAVCVHAVKAANSTTPTVYALAGTFAEQARNVFDRAKRLAQEIDLSNQDSVEENVRNIKKELKIICGDDGVPYGEYKVCLEILDKMVKESINMKDTELKSIAQKEITEAVEEADQLGRRFVVHFLRCSYLMQPKAVGKFLSGGAPSCPAVLMGCAGGVIMLSVYVPPKMVSSEFTAETWLRCMLPVFRAKLMPPKSGGRRHTYAEMIPAQVSLINCEQLVQDAMRVAIQFAQAHLADRDGEPSKDSQQN